MYEDTAFQSLLRVFLNYFCVITADYNPASLTTAWNEFNSPVLQILPAYCKLMSERRGFSLIYCTRVSRFKQHLAELLDEAKCKFGEIAQEHVYTCGDAEDHGRLQQGPTCTHGNRT